MKENIINLDVNTYRILKLCDEKTNICQLSKSVGMAYKNVLARLKLYEQEGYLKKTQINNPNKANSVQTIYLLTKKGESLLRYLNSVNQTQNIAHFDIPTPKAFLKTAEEIYWAIKLRKR